MEDQLLEIHGKCTMLLAITITVSHEGWTVEDYKERVLPVLYKEAIRANVTCVVVRNVVDVVLTVVFKTRPDSVSSSCFWNSSKMIWQRRSGVSTLKSNGHH